MLGAWCSYRHHCTKNQSELSHPFCEYGDCCIAAHPICRVINCNLEAVKSSVTIRYVISLWDGNLMRLCMLNEHQDDSWQCQEHHPLFHCRVQNSFCSSWVSIWCKTKATLMAMTKPHQPRKSQEVEGDMFCSPRFVFSAVDRKYMTIYSMH